MNHPIIYEAEYREDCTHGRGNPLVEVLRKIEDDRRLAGLLEYNQPYSQDDRSLPPEERRQALSILQSLFIVLPHHLGLYHSIQRMLRHGYDYRNPCDPKFYSQIGKQRARLSSQLAVEAPLPGSPCGFSIIGPSGIGKTTAIRRVLQQIPQVIEHQQYKGNPLPLLQVTWLRVDVPFDASIKGLVLKFFAEMDRAAGTGYCEKWVNTRNTVDELMPKMAAVGALHALGCLVIDEVQHLQAGASGGTRRMLNFFVELGNTMGIPIVLVGTPQAEGILTAEARSARRSVGPGAGGWTRMENDDLFRLFMRKLWVYQYTNVPTPLDPEILDAFYHCTQGITDLAVKLYMSLQDSLIDSGDERITPRAIEEAATADMKMMAPYVLALREKKISGSLGDLIAPEAITALPALTQSTEEKTPPKPSNTPKRRTRSKQNESNRLEIQNATANAAKDPREALQEKGIIKSINDLIPATFLPTKS